jgi:hypothetical protein
MFWQRELTVARRPAAPIDPYNCLLAYAQHVDKNVAATGMQGRAAEAFKRRKPK